MKGNGMDGVKELLRSLGREMGEALGAALVESVQAQLPRLREELGTARAAATPVRRASSERGAKVSASLTRPSCSTTTRSAAMATSRRWEMTTVVRPCITRR